MSNFGRGYRYFAAGWIVSLCLVGRAPAADPVSPPDPHDISGMWFGVGNNDPTNGFYAPIEGGKPPYTEAGLALRKRREDAAKSGMPIRQPADDCMPHGVPAVIRLPTPLQIIQTPGLTTILTEASHTLRLIYMDEKQPAHPDPAFMGHSVGHWEGDTLVVDTIGLRPNWLDPQGDPASDRMHVVERIRKIDNGKKLEDVFVLDDPKMYTQPWTARREYLWYPSERIEEYICEENNDITKNGAQKVELQ